MASMIRVAQASVLALEVLAWSVMALVFVASLMVSLGCGPWSEETDGERVPVPGEVGNEVIDVRHGLLENRPAEMIE